MTSTGLGTRCERLAGQRFTNNNAGTGWRLAWRIMVVAACTSPLILTAQTARVAPAQTLKQANPWGSVTRTTTPAQKAEQTYHQALNLIQRGQLVQAQEGLLQALADDPDQPDVRLLLAHLNAERGDTATAQALLKEGLQRTPQSLAFSVALAQMQLQSGHLNEAVTTLTEAWLGGQNHPEYLALLAALVQKQGHHAAAQKYYVSALRLMPENGHWWVGLGLALQSQQLHADAAEAYQRAIELGLPPALWAYAQAQSKPLETAR